MVTEQEIQKIRSKGQAVENEKPKLSYQVTAEEMKRFEKNNRLPKMISARKMRNDKELGIKATLGYDAIEESCQISITSLKKTINGSDRPTRTFLYKFAVGLHMSVEEANQYFALCGGVLREDSVEDYICIKALEDSDNIFQFVEDYETYVGKKISR